MTAVLLRTTASQEHMSTTMRTHLRRTSDSESMRHLLMVWLSHCAYADSTSSSRLLSSTAADDLTNVRDPKAADDPMCEILMVSYMCAL